MPHTLCHTLTAPSGASPQFLRREWVGCVFHPLLNFNIENAHFGANVICIRNTARLPKDRRKQALTRPYQIGNNIATYSINISIPKSSDGKDTACAHSAWFD